MTKFIAALMKISDCLKTKMFVKSCAMIIQISIFLLWIGNAGIAIDDPHFFQFRFKRRIELPS